MANSVILDKIFDNLDFTINDLNKGEYEGCLLITTTLENKTFLILSSLTAHLMAVI